MSSNCNKAVYLFVFFILAGIPIRTALCIEQFTISRDDRYHEAWPNICRAPNGDLVCSYSEGCQHGGGSVPSAVVRISKDEGRTWSEPVVVETLNWIRDGFIMCRSILCLQDGSLLLAADWNTRKIDRPPGGAHAWDEDPANNTGACVWLYRSFDNGQTWTGPEKTGCLAVSLNIKQIKDGTIFISASHYHCQGQYWSQAVYRSTDNGKTWSGPITVLDDPARGYCEGDIVEMPGGELVMYIREDSQYNGMGTKAISYDGGLTWEGPFSAGKWPIVGRVSAGRLSSGEVLVTHRVGGFALQRQYGYFIETQKAALTKFPYDNRLRSEPSEGSCWGMIDNDISPTPDYGYGGWIELPNGDVFVVDYIVDNAPRNRPQIRGYRISRHELFNPSRELTIDFEPPMYKRGKLDSQQGWIRQDPAYWFTRGGSPGTLDNLNNYILVDVSGKYSYAGKASITGSQNERDIRFYSLRGEEVLRRDIGPYDLVQENVEISLIHSGRQFWGMFRVLDASGQTMVELRSDFLNDELWVKYGKDYTTVSDLNCEKGWWETKLVFTWKDVTIYTRPAGTNDFGLPWCSAPLGKGEKYLIKDNVNIDLTGIGNLDRVISAIAVVLADRGAMYIDSIKIRTIRTVLDKK